MALYPPPGEMRDRLDEIYPELKERLDEVVSLWEMVANGPNADLFHAIGYSESKVRNVYANNSRLLGQVVQDVETLRDIMEILDEHNIRYE